jgi:DNA mismatch endonuclease (patch repair protein)
MQMVRLPADADSGSWATSPGVRRSMQGNRSRDTQPEVLVRSALHRRGLRFRKNLLLRAASVRVRPDIVFTAKRVAVFVDGCFWHRCPEHGSDPKSNTGYWKPKLDRNVRRDRVVTEALQEQGWTVVRIWEHESVEEAVGRIRSAVGDGH